MPSSAAGSLTTGHHGPRLPAGGSGGLRVDAGWALFLLLFCCLEFEAQLPTIESSDFGGPEGDLECVLEAFHVFSFSSSLWEAP